MTDQPSHGDPQADAADEAAGAAEKGGADRAAGTQGPVPVQVQLRILVRLLIGAAGAAHHAMGDDLDPRSQFQLCDLAFGAQLTANEAMQSLASDVAGHEAAPATEPGATGTDVVTGRATHDVWRERLTRLLREAEAVATGLPPELAGRDPLVHDVAELYRDSQAL